MVLTAEEYSERAAFHEKAADDESVSREGRILFARKANWFRILARIAAETGGFGGPLMRPSDETPRAGPLTELQSEALLFSPRRLWAARFAAEAFNRKKPADHCRTTNKKPPLVRSLLERPALVTKWRGRRAG